MKKLYAKGYIVTVESWENDADNYKTEVYHTTSEANARAVAKFALLFKLKNNSANGIGNMYEPDETELGKVERTFREFYAQNPAILEENAGDENLEEYMVSWMIEIASDLGLSEGEFYTRVCSKVEVARVPNDVFIEDVTK